MKRLTQQRCAGHTLLHNGEEGTNNVLAPLSFLSNSSQKPQVSDHLD